jgi:hypothetical protein
VRRELDRLDDLPVDDALLVHPAQMLGLLAAEDKVLDLEALLLREHLELLLVARRELEVVAVDEQTVRDGPRSDSALALTRLRMVEFAADTTKRLSK